MRINVVNLVKHFGPTKAVDDISFGFTSGQIYGFIGPNGAGKTTTMRILATLDEPSSGDAFVDGVSVVEYPERARRLVGYVPDHLPTHRDMTVHDYLDFFGRAYGIHSPKRQQIVEQIEEFTNLTGIREKHLIRLSKGMKQRVSLARALLHDPPVLIMDEPAAGLDPRARVELRDLLKILSEQGKAILISSHILTELAEICNGVVIIEHGHILRAGTLQEIQHSDELVRVVRIRVLEKADELRKHLLQQPHVEKASLADGSVEVEIEGDDAVCCTLLADLIKEGFRILEFRLMTDNLEDIFMKATKGEVQ